MSHAAVSAWRRADHLRHRWRFHDQPLWPARARCCRLDRTYSRKKKQVFWNSRTAFLFDDGARYVFAHENMVVIVKTPQWDDMTTESRQTTTRAAESRQPNVTLDEVTGIASSSVSETAAVRDMSTISQSRLHRKTKEKQAGGRMEEPLHYDGNAARHVIRCPVSKRDAGERKSCGSSKHHDGAKVVLAGVVPSIMRRVSVNGSLLLTSRDSVLLQWRRSGSGDPCFLWI